MSKTATKTTSNIFEYFKWKYFRLKLQRKQSKLQRLYQQQKYQKLCTLFKSQKDYQQLTFDSFPFLYFMISQNNTKAVQKFMQKYPHKQFLLLNDNNPLKCTPIQYALLQNKQQMQQIIQKHGGNILLCNNQGQNILHLSAIYRRNQAFNLAIRRNVSHDHIDQYGNTPFHYASRVGSVEMITTMLQAKAKRIANKINQYPIHMAIQSGKLQCLNLLKSDIDRPYPKYHPIHSAARSNDLQIFRTIYQKNPQFILLRDQNNSTALHHAVSIQSLQITKYILERLSRLGGSQILNAQDNHGNTALHLSFLNSNLQILGELIHRKPNTNIQNQDQLTPLDYGHNSDSMAVKRFLMDLQGQKKHKLRQ